ncbi:phage capsid protein [Embleya scabrispora]|uniref:Phage capsid protein n=1 Tax=Embleya scabrispora TaxID=159449 RepID=A0A1T3P573_9ACTN|nr:phage major capsid protein [Embleya scabrispora]OPC84239.1 phage capsid protein [Embleya scabrispora]
MAATPPIKLSNVDAALLPRILTGPIFEKSVEQSAVMQLSKRIPLAIDTTTSIPVPLDVPTADWVGEAQRKPISSGAVAIKTMTAKKIAVLIPVSEEVAKTNAGGLWTQLQNDLPTAFARAFDFATIHGKTMRGATGPFADYLTKTSQSVTLGTATKANGGLWADFVTGMKTITNNDYDLTGFVADYRLKPDLMLSTDLNGRPFFADTTTSPVTDRALSGSLLAQPLAYSRSVSGKQRRQSTSTDTGLRAVGGDWSQTAYGVGMDITVRISNEATYIDEEGAVHSAFQENLVLLLAEAYYGYVQGDDDAFVKYVGTPSGS